MVNVLDLELNAGQMAGQGQDVNRILDQIGQGAVRAGQNVDEFGRRLTAAGEVSSRYIPKFRGLFEALQIGQNVRSIATDIGSLGSPLTSVGEVAGNAATNILLLGVNLRQFATVAGPAGAVIVGLTALVGLISALPSRSREAAQAMLQLVGSARGLATATGPTGQASGYAAIAGQVRQQAYKADVEDPFGRGESVSIGTLAKYIPEFAGPGYEYSQSQKMSLSQYDLALRNFSTTRQYDSFTLGLGRANALAATDPAYRAEQQSLYAAEDIGNPKGLADMVRKSYEFQRNVESARSLGQDLATSFASAFDPTRVRSFTDALRAGLEGIVSTLFQRGVGSLANAVGNIFASTVASPTVGGASARIG